MNIILKNYRQNPLLKLQGISKRNTPSQDIDLEIDLDVYTNADIQFFIDFAPINSEGFQLNLENAKPKLELSKNQVLQEITDAQNFHGSFKYSGLKKIKKNKSSEETLTPFALARFQKSDPKKIVFLDRDGVLIKDTGYPHGRNITHLDTHISYLKKMKKKDYQFIVITNQSGIGRGLYSKKDYLITNNLIEDELLKHDINILDWFYCPYHQEGQDSFRKRSIDRKPSPGMILQACEKYSIDLSSSIMIGDRQSDRLHIHLKEYKIFDQPR